MISIKEDISQDKITQSDFPIDEKQQNEQIDQQVPPSFGNSQQMPQNNKNIFQLGNQTVPQNTNSTSQDKLLKSGKGVKKRVKMASDNDLSVKKRLGQSNPPIPSKKTNISDNSDESNQNQEHPPPVVPQKIIDSNTKIRDYFKVTKEVKSISRDTNFLKENDRRQANSESINQSNQESRNQEYKLRVEIETLQQENKQLQQRCSEKEQRERQLQAELKTVSNNYRQENERNTQYRKSFAQILLKNEEYRREMSKIQIEKEKSRLGEFIQRRESVRFVDEWNDGFEIRQIKEAIRQKEGEKDELERRKKDIKIKEQHPKKNGMQQKLNFQYDTTPHINDNSNNSTNFLELDGVQKKERINFQLSIILKEEQDLKSKLNRLEEEKIQFIIRLKKYNEEIKYSRPNPETQEIQWPLLSDRYQLLSLLGKGGFSEVYKGYDLMEQKLSACKIHNLNPNWPEQCKANYIKHALRETEIHQHLKHQNIVQLYDTIEINSESFCTVLEYCDGLDLSHHLKKYQQLSEKEAKIIIRQILSALNYLSSQQTKIIHYDLKPQNILFHKGEVKISDFGLCKIIDNDQTRMELTSQGLGTYWYLPPECFLTTDQPPTISTKVDVWSVGVIMFEMIYGLRPFGHGMSQDRIAKVDLLNKKQIRYLFIQEQIILKSTTVTFPNKPTVTMECKDFIKKCLTYCMENRWDVTDAYYNSYISNQK